MPAPSCLDAEIGQSQSQPQPHRRSPLQVESQIIRGSVEGAHAIDAFGLDDVLLGDVLPKAAESDECAAGQPGQRQNVAGGAAVPGTAAPFHGLVQEQGEQGRAQKECPPFAQRDGSLLGGERGDKGESDNDKEEAVAGAGRWPLGGACWTSLNDEPQADQRQTAVNADFDKIERPPRQNRQRVEVQRQGEEQRARSTRRANADRRHRAGPIRRR